MIQINPLKSYIDGGVRAALTTPPSASLVFDLPGKAIWVKGVKLKGTDHTYTFSHDNYTTLINTPDKNNPESEDIKIGVNITTLKKVIDTTYNGGTLALLQEGLNTEERTWLAKILHNYINNVLPITKNIKINNINYAIYTAEKTLPLFYAPTSLGTSGQILSCTSSGLSWVNLIQNTDYRVSLSTATNNNDYRIILKQEPNNNPETSFVRFSEYLTFNPSTKTLKINNVKVITNSDIYVGATSTTNAITGLVPVATSALYNYFLRGDGTWAIPSNTWRPVKVEGTEKLGSNALDLSAGNGISIIYNSDTKKIVITNTKPDVNHNTDRTGIKLATVSGTKKTDSTLILANSATGLNIQGGTNKFLIGDGTNYIEVPVIPSVSNKDAIIGTTLTTIATIAGVDIKAKIASYSLSNHTHSVKINGSTKTIAASGAVDLGNYLPLSGGTMGGTAWIVWPDSGNWSNGNRGVTFPVIRGGLQWSGLSDYVKLFSEEISNDNLNLVLQFGDDNSNGLSIRNASNVQTSYISAGGVITTKTFKGNLDWSYITNKPSSYTPSAHTHAWNSLTHSSTTENQAILTNGSANGWKLYTLNISGWNNAANNAHSHSNKSVLDGITSTLVNSWNTAYNFVNTISGTDTDKVINKWDEIVNFLAGITEDDKLNTLLNSKLSVYELANNTNVGTIKNNGIYYSTTDTSSGTLINSPFSNSFTLINMTSYDGGDDLRRSRLAFNAHGEIKISDDRSRSNTAETWHNILTSKNSGISGSTIKLNGTSITVYSSSTADGRYVKKTGDTMSGVLAINTTGFGALTIKRNDDTNGASIQFRGNSNVYGYIGLNNSTKDKLFLRWSSDTSKIYTILDTSSTYVSSGKGIINGTTITQVDNATNATNASNANKLNKWFSSRIADLNLLFGDGALRIFNATSSTTANKCPSDSSILHLAWDNNNGYDSLLALDAKGNNIYFRGQDSGTWNSWRTVLHNGNSLISGSTITINGSSITVSKSDHTHPYLPLAGGTITGALNFANNTWNKIGDDSYIGDCNNGGMIGIKAANTTYPGIAFFNNTNTHLGNLTAYSNNIKYRTYSLQFLDNGNTNVSAGTWMNPFSTYNASAVADGQAICVWGQSSYLSNLASDSGNMSLWLKRVSTNSATLNMVLDGEYYANGNLRLAHVSEIPTSLKNPYALTISLNGTSLGAYDGSAAKNINITPSSIGAATNGHNHDSSYVKYAKVTKSTADSANANPYIYNIENEAVISGYYNYWYILNLGQYSKGNFGTLIAMPYQDSLTDSELFIRSAKNGSWRAWRRVLHSNNYASILDSRYYTESESDGRFVNVTGDTMTGPLQLNGSPSQGNPPLQINYTSNFEPSDLTIGLLKFGKLTTHDMYLGISPTTRTHFGRVGYFMHVNSNCEFTWASSGWTNLMALTGGTGNLWVKGSVTTGSFIKSGSSNSYVLLGGGNHKLVSDFATSAQGVGTIISISKSLTPTTSWIDTGIKTDSATFPGGNGSYIVQISVPSSSGTDGWGDLYTGYFSLFTGTNSSTEDEILLHGASHALLKRIYLKTKATENTDGTMHFYIASEKAFSAARTINFKFRKLI